MRKFIQWSVFSLTLVLLVMGLVWRQQQVAAAAWEIKVDPWVIETAVSQSTTEFLVYLTAQADLSGAEALPTKEAKGQYVYDQLTAVANRTQPPVLAQLDTLGLAYQPFWIANMIWVRGDLNAIATLARRDDVAHLYANPSVPLPAVEVDYAALNEAIESIEWNITQVNADDVWAMGYTGAGIVIGGQDTGYMWNHTGLINQYRGWSGSTADHNYNWHDAIHTGDGGSCGLNSPTPCDDNGHGTHTMGTMVGNDLAPTAPGWPASATNAVGMAPGARWIGCRNMDVGNGTPATYAECYQWFIAPTDLNNQNANPALAPHVINNSWGCPASEGCTDPNVLLTVVDSVRAAGIVTVHSAGNAGSNCSTVNTPSAIYDASFTVGSTTSSDTISGFSSRGPVTVDGSNRMKPDISAPGSSIRSTFNGGGYGVLSGTSMAGPHVAGLIGLLLSANPTLAGDVDAIETVIEQTAFPRTTTQGCGGDLPTDIPNNVFGWGRIDALAAVTAVENPPHALSVSKSTTATWVAPGDVLTYTLTLTHTHPVSHTTNVVLSDTLPVGTSLVTATLPFTFDGSTITWPIGDLIPGGVASAFLVVRVSDTAVDDITNSQYIASSDDAQSGPGVPVTTPLLPYALNLHKTAADTVPAGGLITYTLTVTNRHPLGMQHQVTLSDTIPAQTTFVTATQPAVFDGTAVTWTTPTLAPGTTWTVQLIVQANPNASQGIENTDYAVWSDEVTTAVSGPIVSTLVVYYWLYLPLIVQP